MFYSIHHQGCSKCSSRGHCNKTASRCKHCNWVLQTQFHHETKCDGSSTSFTSCKGYMYRNAKGEKKTNKQNGTIHQKNRNHHSSFSFSERSIQGPFGSYVSAVVPPLHKLHLWAKPSRDDRGSGSGSERWKRSTEEQENYSARVVSTPGNCNYSRFP